MSSILLNGLLLGWSVALPPGPINAEMIRRMLTPASDGGGFWASYVGGNFRPLGMEGGAQPEIFGISNRARN